MWQDGDRVHIQIWVYLLQVKKPECCSFKGRAYLILLYVFMKRILENAEGLREEYTWRVYLRMLYVSRKSIPENAVCLKEEYT